MWKTYQTKDGRPYYYNTTTKETTWTKPNALNEGSAKSKKTAETSSKKAADSTNKDGKKAPSGLPDRSNLMAAIQSGAKLKKTVTRESKPIVSESSAPSSSGGSMMDAIKGGQRLLRKTSASSTKSAPMNNTPPQSGGGGFAEIMRKNREAAARKAAQGGLNAGSESAPKVSSPVVCKPRSSWKTSPVVCTPKSMDDEDDRLERIEAKLDKIMKHLGID